MKRMLAVAWIGMAPWGLALAADQDDRALLLGAAARHGLAPASKTETLTDAERAARAELAVASAKLELILAKKALAANQLADAAGRAEHILALLKGLPATDAITEMTLQADGIVARAERAGLEIHASDAPASNAAEMAAPAMPTTEPQPADQAVRMNTDVIRERDLRQLEHDVALRERYKSDETRVLSDADEARVVPYNDVDYPPDWPERVAKREKYANGQAARSKSTVDEQGREWYAAVYDISDLTYEPPDFHPASSMFLDENLRDALDREALRQRSQIFGGYASDLAAGIPLLRFFGGVDDYEFRGSKYSSDRQRQIAEMTNAFMQRMNEPKVISVP